MYSAAEASAMRLDGDLAPLANGYVHVDRLDTPMARLSALGLPFKRQHIVVGLAAAWALGAAPLPEVFDVACLRHRRALAPPGCRTIIRNISLTDCIDAGGVLVTNRMRTAVDILTDTDDVLEVTPIIAMLTNDWDALRLAITLGGRAGHVRVHARLEHVIDTLMAAESR